MTFKEWTARFEVKNAPHIGRGATMAFLFFLFQFWRHQQAIAWLPLVATIGLSICWEIWDEIRFSFKMKGDGFDWWDIASDAYGALLVQSVIWILG